MKKGSRKIELVAPAGGWDHLKAALNGGADAVYLGYSKFGARAYAQNFDFAMLKKAAVLARSRKAKLYLTLNTLIKDSEMPEVAHFLNRYQHICQDGIIIQDLGVYKLIQDHFPHIRLHASTQMNVHSLQGAAMLEQMGIKRVVLAREMTLEQIRHITQNSPIEVEVFGHGSQCYAFSGHCYLSSFVSGRSGNRGRCSQPCRMKYRLLYRDQQRFYRENKKHLYYLSKKDLCAIGLLPQLIESGIDALKIEGRMKTPEYVGMVTKIYKKYMEAYYSNPQNYAVAEKDAYKLNQIFLRDSDVGYLKETFPKKIINPKTSGSIGNFCGRVESLEYGKNKKRPQAAVIKTKIPIYRKDLLEIWTNRGNERMTVKKADKIGKKGTKTLYRIPIKKPIYIAENDRVFKYFDHKLEGEAKSLYKYDHVQAKAKPERQHQGFGEEALNQYLNEYGLQKAQPKNKESSRRWGISVNVYDLEAAALAADCGAQHIIYQGKPQKALSGLDGYCRQKGATLFYHIPRIAYEKDFAWLASMLDPLIKKGFANFEVCSLAGFHYVLGMDQPNGAIIMGRDMHTANTLAAVQMAEQAGDLPITEIELSNELNIREAADLCQRFKAKHNIALSMFGYGHFPVMAARFRFDMLARHYSSSKDYYLEDLKGYKFRVDADMWGNLLVFNAKKICNFFDLDQAMAGNLDLLRLDFRFLDPKSQKKILEAYTKAADMLHSKGREGYRKFCDYFRDDRLFKDYTRGHMLRGVQ